MSAISNTLFRDNRADDNGGALYLSDSLTAAPFCNNVTFSSNSALALGGALYVNSLTSSGFLKSSYFSNKYVAHTSCCPSRVANVLLQHCDGCWLQRGDAVHTYRRD